MPDQATGGRRRTEEQHLPGTLPPRIPSGSGWYPCQLPAPGGSLTLRSSSEEAEKNQVRCFLLMWTILKGKTLLDVVSSAARITLRARGQRSAPGQASAPSTQHAPKDTGRSGQSHLAHSPGQRPRCFRRRKACGQGQGWADMVLGSGRSSWEQQHVGLQTEDTSPSLPTSAPPGPWPACWGP